MMDSATDGIVTLGNGQMLSAAVPDSVLDQHQGKAAPAQKTAKQWRAEFKNRAAQCSELGLPYFLLLAPDKHSVYWEQYSQAPDVRISEEMFKGKGLPPMIDPLPQIRAIDALHGAYPPNDSRWSHHGAYAAYRVMMDRLGFTPLALESFEFMEAPQLGDLGKKSAPQLISRYPRLMQRMLKATPIFDNMVMDSGRVRILMNREGKGVLVVFGDAFAHRLIDFLAESFAIVVLAQTTGFDAALLPAVPGTIVVSVFAESELMHPPKFPEDAGITGYIREKLEAGTISPKLAATRAPFDLEPPLPQYVESVASRYAVRNFNDGKPLSLPAVAFKPKASSKTSVPATPVSAVDRPADARPALKNAGAFWKQVQNPVTRSNDPVVLLAEALTALRGSNNPHVMCSAACVIIYRYLETPELRAQVDLPELWGKITEAKRLLERQRDLQSMRWFVSINMAMANLHVLLGDFAGSLDFLMENVARKSDAMMVGQPFTNVVKSAAAALGMMKYVGGAFSADMATRLVTAFGRTNAEVTQNYLFENQWVYEELALVYRTLYAISRLFHTAKFQPITAELLAEFDDTAIPTSFLRMIKPVQ